MVTLLKTSERPCTSPDVAALLAPVLAAWDPSSTVLLLCFCANPAGTSRAVNAAVINIVHPLGLYLVGLVLSPFSFFCLRFSYLRPVIVFPKFTDPTSIRPTYFQRNYK